MAYSGALKITDLDDFLTPSQACIIPVRSTANPPASISSRGESSSTEIHIDDENNYYEVSTYSTALASSSKELASTAGVEVAGRQALKKAEISLNDCLACSGCITSTESLLITMQSHKEVLEFIRSPASSKRTPVLSISPQSLASLSASYSAAYSRPPIPLLTLLRRIRSFLARTENGAWFTWDTTFARHVSLRESVDEFFSRRQAIGGGGKVTKQGTKASFVSGDGRKEGQSIKTPASGPLPVLASACPGWVCYAEKAQGDLLPFLSAARSSQGVMGALVKTWWGEQTGRTPDDIYHVTAMPCYDKKLEASRPDFNSGGKSKSRETDCVVTTGELDLLLSELGFEPFANLDEREEEAMDVDGEKQWGQRLESRIGSPWPELMEHKGSSSGSYLATIINAVSTAHGSPTRLIERAIRGSEDNVEYILEDVTTGTVIFKGAKCYGFRNLQNLVRRVIKETGLGGRGGAGRLSAAVAARRKKNRLASGLTGGDLGTGGSETPTTAEGSDVEKEREEKKLDYVEVMACPGGCVNGGGQMKPASEVTTGQRAEKEKEKEVGVVSESSGVDERMRWSTKEWVAKVENIYWTGLPTPPVSPPPGLTNASSPDHMAEEVIKALDGYGKLNVTFSKVDGDVLSKANAGGLTHEQVVW